MFCGGTGKPYMAGRLDSTVCLSQVEAFIKGNDVAQEAIKVVGEHKVEVTLNAMVGYSTRVHMLLAPYQLNRSRILARSARTHIIQRLLQRPLTCVSSSASHLTECDGKCGHFHPEQCPKTSAPSRRQSEPKCSIGLQLCGADTNKGWECADFKISALNCESQNTVLDLMNHVYEQVVDAPRIPPSAGLSSMA